VNCATKLSPPHRLITPSIHFFAPSKQLFRRAADNSDMNGKGTPRGLMLASFVALLLAVGLGALSLGTRQAVRRASAPREQPRADDPSPPWPAEAAERRRSVDATVAARNEMAHRDEEAFRRAGWHLVATEPPDARLTALDPALLDGRERELRVQIASTTASPALAARLGRIAAEAREPATRVAAVEALGRAGGPEAQAQLLTLVDKLPEGDDARRALVPLLRPRALDDDEAPKLAALLESPSLTQVEKQQLAFTLALVGLRDGMKLPPSLPLSPNARRMIDSMTLLAQRGSAATQGGSP
jgi:hypothetical protein